ncbi:hypothetical protein AXF42_Ash019453 [Apostasia shenzhenica]|uniref:Uncharacterized protein n=1 Tax=Apostasia shenzhenica TaxID=1088818 RepID=A0A2I0AYD6_9ASPA|nr:hypothetical protein AXF42_Ash019453 [Apostasia shenzhenica]
MVCGDSAVSQAFGFLWSSCRCISFLGPRELPGLHPTDFAVGYFMGPPNKFESVSECRSIGTRDWHWDDLLNERSAVPPTATHFESALRSLKNGMVCGDSAVSKAFGIPWSSHGSISFLGAPVLLGLHPANRAAGY